MTTSEQARADAMADAETLRMARGYSAADPLEHAAAGALWTVTHPNQPWSPCSSTDPYVWALVAARLWLRAVPGLRG